MKPSTLAGKSESSQQIALFCWASHAAVREALPELRWLHHIPNGGSRGDQKLTQMITGANLKAEGVKPGVADLFLPVPNGEFYGLYIEMKAPGKLHATTNQQDEFGEFVKSQGYHWIVADNWREAALILVHYIGDGISDYSALFEGV